MTPLYKNKWQNLLFLTYQVDDEITNHLLQFEQNVYSNCICFEMRKTEISYIFLLIVNYMYFEMTPKNNKSIDLLWNFTGALELMYVSQD